MTTEDEKYKDSIYVLEHAEEYNPRVVAKASYYVEGFNAGKESQLQALKEGVIHDEAELDKAATEYINGPGKAYPRGGGFKDGALWMLDWIKTNLITNLEDNG